VAVRSKVYVCNRWIDGIMVRIPVEGMDVLASGVCSVGSGLCDSRLLLQRSPTFCVCVRSKNLKNAAA
jgi:hypothetical protein